MNKQDYNQLKAEICTLEDLLKSIPKTHVIDRIGLEERKKEIEEKLASEPAPTHKTPTARLTFRGKPVVGNYGIYADFSSKALNAFSESVATIAANQNSSLGERGTLPNRDNYHLLITGIALGSFRFELEPATDGQALFQDTSIMEEAMERIQSIMRASIGTDDELTEAIADLDNRTIDTVKSFLKELADKEAICAFSYKDSFFQFESPEQIRRSENRLSSENILEEKKTIIGVFLGFLPNRKSFEFEVSETKEIIFGKVSNEMEKPEEINQILNKKVKISTLSRRAGTGKPRYTLVGFELDE
ncbi:MAG TPA: hypothetical protein PK581_07130 [Caldisericia bacterium]|nr:hypothetical protein [Caldisericia bacterium]